MKGWSDEDAGQEEIVVQSLLINEEIKNVSEEIKNLENKIEKLKKTVMKGISIDDENNYDVLVSYADGKFLSLLGGSQEQLNGKKKTHLNN
jgi:hypothetical protein